MQSIKREFDEWEGRGVGISIGVLERQDINALGAIKIKQKGKRLGPTGSATAIEVGTFRQSNEEET
jgi:hypothetical protein